MFRSVCLPTGWFVLRDVLVLFMLCVVHYNLAGARLFVECNTRKSHSRGRRIFLKYPRCVLNFTHHKTVGNGMLSIEISSFRSRFCVCFFLMLCYVWDELNNTSRAMYRSFEIKSFVVLLLLALARVVFIVYFHFLLLHFMLLVCLRHARQRSHERLPF